MRSPAMATSLVSTEDRRCIRACGCPFSRTSIDARLARGGHDARLSGSPGPVCSHSGSATTLWQRLSAVEAQWSAADGIATIGLADADCSLESRRAAALSRLAQLLVLPALLLKAVVRKLSASGGVDAARF